MSRYEIVWAELDPARGSEIAKTRPVVIVSLNLLNDVLATVTVCPLTSQIHPGWRSRIQVRCAGKPAEIAVDQIRTISKQRLGRTVSGRWIRTDEASRSAMRPFAAKSKNCRQKKLASRSLI